MAQEIALTDEWIVLSKPAGWLTIPGRRPGAEVLSEWATRQYGGKAWTVHRIDLETSGLVLFARSVESHRKASLWFQERQVRKAYDCIAAGEPATPVFRMKSPIEGAQALTQAEVKERFASAFLARAVPVSGKRHQIRIHFSQAGYPLLGDPKYGGPTETGGVAVGRVALHAARLELPSGEKFEAPWPDDFRGWVERLRA